MSNIFSYQSFFKTEGGKYREENYSGRIYLTTDKNHYSGNDFLKDMVEELRTARDIKDQASEHDVMKAIADWNGLKKVNDKYVVYDQQKLNIGVLHGIKQSLYSL